MSANIPWTHISFNPLTGCTKYSDGCTNCYAKPMAIRMSSNPNPKIADSVFKAEKDKVKSSGFEGAEKVIFTADLEWLQNKGKTKEFLDLAYENMDKYYSEDPRMLSRVSWIVSSMTTDLKYLGKALSWSKKSISIRAEPFNTDTYASILFKMGKKEEAIKQEKKVIELAKQQKISTTPYDEALKKMEESK